MRLEPSTPARRRGRNRVARGGWQQARKATLAMAANARPFVGLATVLVSVLLALVIGYALYSIAATRYLPGVSTRGSAASSIGDWNVPPPEAVVSSRPPATDLSALYGRPALSLVAEAAVNSAILITLAIVLAAATAIPAGFWLALRAPRQLRSILETVVSLGITVPAFFIAFVLQVIAIFLTERAGHTILPVFGYGLDGHLVIPVASLAIAPFAFIARSVSLVATDALNREYVRTARAKGLAERVIVWRHLLPNLLGATGEAVIGGLRLSLGALVIIEYLLVWPGLGLLSLRALSVQDTGVVVLVIGVLGAAFVALDASLDLLTRRTGVVSG